jgi:hypothetical protein
VAADGDVAVGDSALQRADEHPEGFVEDVMGRLLDDGVITASGRTLAAEVVLAHLLAQAYARCVEVLDGAPDGPRTARLHGHAVRRLHVRRRRPGRHRRALLVLGANLNDLSP